MLVCTSYQEDKHAISQGIMNFYCIVKSDNDFYEQLEKYYCLSVIIRRPMNSAMQKTPTIIVNSHIFNYRETTIIMQESL